MIDEKVLVNIEKGVLDSKFEISQFEENFKELENLDDLWYFIKSSSAAWIAGSAS
ncbi:epipeptide YydF family RiPP [Clostridium amazonitimonense]|uniref:epipeptide YydF family RiPP n=1 Tax=Clostridium amazonitimonense TaxID=1499689 RepID=UPI0009DE0144|nr:epipeptide YydF family RiPP [Clostridium amazonitimonense]